MKAHAYKLAALLLSVFPERWNNKDTQGAVLGFIAVALLISIGWRAVPWLVRFFF